MNLLRRHVSGDWGSIHPGDRGLNEQALRTGERLFSVYDLDANTTVWIITEATGDDGHRASTCRLMPSEY